MKYINRFLWWCAGANISILEESPTDQSKYFGLGGTIFFTALMASFAGGYAFYTAFKDIPLSFFFGGFWGILIFNLDRFIVSSTGKGDGTVKITWEEWSNALPRLILAIIIGFVVAVPLELKVFEREINVEIKKMQNEERKQINEGYGDLESTIAQLNTKKVDLDKELTNIETALNGGDIIIKLNQGELDKLKKDKADKENQLYKARKNYNNGKSRFVRYDKRLKDIERDENVLNIPESTINEYKKKRWFGKSAMNKYGPVVADLRKEVGIINSQIKTISSEKGGREITLKEDFIAQQKKISIEKERIDKEITKLDSTLIIRKQEGDDVSIQFDGLMARLIAMDRLSYDIDTTFKSIQTNFSTLSEDSLGLDLPIISQKEVASINKTKTPVYYAKWMISILLICIEIAPILFKMMTESGPYDDRIEEIRYKSELDKKKFMSDANEKVNTELKLGQALNDNKIQAELLANRELLNTIALAQTDITKAAIESWKKEQLEKVVKNPNQTIKTTPPSNGTLVNP